MSDCLQYCHPLLDHVVAVFLVIFSEVAFYRSLAITNKFGPRLKRYATGEMDFKPYSHLV